MAKVKIEFRGTFSEGIHKVPEQGVTSCHCTTPNKPEEFQLPPNFQKFPLKFQKSVCLGIKYFEHFYFLKIFSDPSHMSRSNMEIFSDMVYRVKYGNVNQKSHLSVSVQENVPFSISLSKPWFFLSRFLDLKNFVSVTGQTDSRVSKN